MRENSRFSHADGKAPSVDTPMGPQRGFLLRGGALMMGDRNITRGEAMALELPRELELTCICGCKEEDHRETAIDEFLVMACRICDCKNFQI